MSDKRQVIILILYLMTLGQMGTDIYLPSFPSMAAALKTDLAAIQLSFSVFMVGFGLSQLLYGPASDRWGRKPFLILGVGLYCIMSMLISISTTAWQLLMLRSLQGIGAGACSVIPRAIMRDKFSGKNLAKMAVYQSIVWSMIPISAPLLGSYIEHYLGWRDSFIFLFLVSLLALLMSLSFKESLAQRAAPLKAKKIIAQYQQILFHQRFYPPMLCAMGVICLISAFNVTSPIILRETLRVSAIHYGWLLVGVAMSFMIGALINRYLLTYYSSDKIERFGVCLIMFSATLLFASYLWLPLSVSSFLLPIFLVQLGSSMLFPGSVAKAMEVFPQMAGQSAAVFGCAIFLGGTATSVLLAYLPSDSLLPLAVIFFLISSLMLFFHALPKARSTESWQEVAN